MPPPISFVDIMSGDLEGVDIGLVSEAFRIRRTSVLAKVPAISPTFPHELHEIEKTVYERLGEHPHILRYFGQSPPECTKIKHALLFEYHPRGIIRPLIHDLHKLSPHHIKLPRQVVSALAHVHSLGVVHADLGLHNLLLNDKGDIVLCDFAGSGIDGSRTYVVQGMRYADPLRRHEEVSQQDDVFALGTVMYELVRRELLFEGLESGEIYDRLEKRQFPDISDIPMPLRGVIEKCWTMPEYTAYDALQKLDVK